VKIAGQWRDANTGSVILLKRSLGRRCYIAFWTDHNGRPDSEALTREEVTRMIARGLLLTEEQWFARGQEHAS